MALPSPALSEAEEEAAVVEVRGAGGGTSERTQAASSSTTTATALTGRVCDGTFDEHSPSESEGKRRRGTSLGDSRRGACALSTLSQSSEELQRIESWQHVQSGSKYNAADDDGDDGGGGGGGGGGGAQYKRSEPLHAAFSILQPKGITPLHSSPQKHGQMQRPSTASARGFSSTSTAQQQPQPLHHRSAPTLARPSTAPPAASSSSHTATLGLCPHGPVPKGSRPPSSAAATLRRTHRIPPSPIPRRPSATTTPPLPFPAAATPSAPVHRPPPIAPAGREEVVAALMAAAASADAPPRTFWQRLHAGKPGSGGASVSATARATASAGRASPLEEVRRATREVVSLAHERDLAKADGGDGAGGGSSSTQSRHPYCRRGRRSRPPLRRTFCSGRLRMR